MRRNKFVRILFHYAFLSAFVLPVYFVAAGTAHAATTVCYSVANRLPNTQLMLRTQMLCSIANMACKFSTPGLDAPDFADRFDACVEKAVTAALGRSGERQELHSDRSSDQQRECDNGTDNAAVIRQCTALIDGGTESGPYVARDYANRGLALRNEGHYDEAEADFAKVIKLGSGLTASDASKVERTTVMVMGYFGQSGVHFQRKQWDAVISDMTMAISFKPKRSDLARAYQTRGLAYGSRAETSPNSVKDLELAYTDFDRAIALNPRDAISLHLRGLIKRNFGRIKGSKDLIAAGDADLKRAKSIDPGIGK